MGKFADASLEFGGRKKTSHQSHQSHQSHKSHRAQFAATHAPGIQHDAQYFYRTLPMTLISPLLTVLDRQRYSLGVACKACLRLFAPTDPPGHCFIKYDYHFRGARL